MRSCKSILVLFILLAGFLSAGREMHADLGDVLVAKQGFDMKVVKRGRYLVKTCGCNDCHTPYYLFSEGNVPESLWLTGSSLGWQGPWGTTYPSNLRLTANKLTEEGWVLMTKALKNRPPMPWVNLNVMTDEDLRAMYQYIRYLGPAGEITPAYVSAGQEPTGPHAIIPQPSE